MKFAGFGSKVINETTLASQRVNNTFHKAGSCKLWLNKDKKQTNKTWNFLYIWSFIPHFLNLL